MRWLAAATLATTAVALSVMLTSGPSAPPEPIVPPPSTDASLHAGEVAAAPATTLPASTSGVSTDADAAPSHAARPSSGRGSILVTVRNPAGDGFEAMIVSLQPWPAKPGTPSVTRSAEADGSARLEHLAAGHYQLHLGRSDKSWQGERRGPNHRPLLGGGLDPLTATQLEVRPGETTTVEVEATPLGRIFGRVLQHGTAVEGVFLFAVTLQTGEEAQPWDGEDAHRYHPWTKTARDGTFRFDYQRPGRWHVHVRHPRASLTSTAALIGADRPGQVIEHDFALGGAAIRGLVDGAGKQRVYLFRAQEAATDPWFGDSVRRDEPPIRGRTFVPLADGGAFQFGLLDAGDWVVRIVAEDQMVRRILAQRFVQTQVNETVDLGRLHWSSRIDVRVRAVRGSEPLPGIEMEVRQKIPGLATPAFLQRSRIEDGYVELRGIEPGDYELTPESHHRFDSRTVRVLADGTTDPATLQF